jgi:hypothetical protein
MMRGRLLLVGVPIWVVLSAVIAYGMFFWTPWFGVRANFGWGRGSVYIPDYINTEILDYTNTYVRWYYLGSSSSDLSSVQELAKRQSAEVQPLVKDLFKDLMKRSNAELYILRSLPDVCLGEIACRRIPSKDVKPFVEAALALRQTIETATIAWRSLYVAAGSLLVAFLSMGLAAFTFVTRKKAA